MSDKLARRDDREQQILEALQQLGAPFVVHEHEPTFTVAESAHLHDELPGMHIKNLFLKDAGGTIWLLTAPAHKPLDLKTMPARIGSKRLSFGSAERLADMLGVEPGSVTPLAAFDDVDGQINVVLDRAVAEAELVYAHPLRNSASLALPATDLIRLLSQHGREPRVVEL